MILTYDEIKSIILDQNGEYAFLHNNPNLSDNLILVGLGGSYAYGTNNEDSDIDIRGIAVNSKRNILLGRDFEQIVDYDTDTTIYSFNKIVKLLCSCNPNTIEILGLKPEQYFIKTELGEELIKNRKLFLSKLAVNSFGGYANSQLRRLESKSARLIGQAEYEKHILESIKFAEVEYKRRYFPYTNDNLKLYVDKSDKEDLESEIFMDLNFEHYPLRDFTGLWNEMHSIVRAYNKMGMRNKKAIEHNKINKHMMHLVRLYLMCFDILECGEINTYRDKEHDFLMSIRNGDYLTDDKKPTAEFYELIDEYEKRLKYDSENTDLPDTPNYNLIDDFVYSITERLII